MTVISLQFAVGIIVFLNADVFSFSEKTIYEKILQDSNLHKFGVLLNNHPNALRYVKYEQVTVFTPDDHAFEVADSDIQSDILLYHITFDLKTLQELNYTSAIGSIFLKKFPIWISHADGDIYVNNAKILQDQSNYIARNRNGYFGKNQIVHVIDEVLNPRVFSIDFTPSAYHFLSNTIDWGFDNIIKVDSFFTKVQEHNLQYIYNQSSGHTFFIPLDSGIDLYKFKMMSKNIILGHVIPYYVLFTRPTRKNFAYETLANDEYTYTVVSFEKRKEKLFVKGFTKENNTEKIQFSSEIVVANIPVKNGVIHIISEPIGSFRKTLKVFPYLPIIAKLSSDPMLSIFYDMGENTGFHDIFKKENVNFTYFVPRDTAWNYARRKGLSPVHQDIDILRKHLIISKIPYSIEQLATVTKINNFSTINLKSEAGILQIKVLQQDGDYYIIWNNKYIKVLRPNYYCTDGIIHVIAGPLINFRKSENKNYSYLNAN